MNIRSLAIISGLIAMLIFAACRKPASEQQPTHSPTPIAAQEAPIGGMAQVGTKYFFRGTIANLSIEMQLLRDGEHLSGSYFYPKVGKSIALSGNVDKDNNVWVTDAQAMDGKGGHKVIKFSQDGKVLEGGWRPDKGVPENPGNAYDATMTRVK